MVVASVAIDNDHTVCLYCEREQKSKVEAMFTQRTWVGLTDAERETLRSEADEADAGYRELIKATEAKLRKKNS